LSARTVAAQAKLKYQIVFYYFETMDDLLVATYRRLMQNMSAILEAALSSDQPLHALWEIWSHPSNGAVWLEFMAIANHNTAIRVEKIAYADQMRELMTERLSGRFDQGENGVYTPFAISTVLACIGGIMAFESALGMADTHGETRALVKWSLEQLEPKKRGAKAKVAAKRKTVARARKARA
jgi:AcrR family transcriptional regulator